MPENPGEKKEKKETWKYAPFYRENGNRKGNEQIRDELRSALRDKGFDEVSADRMLQHTFDQASDEIARAREHEKIQALPDRPREPVSQPTNRTEAKDVLIKQGMSTEEAERFLQKSFDVAKDQARKDSVLYNIVNDPQVRQNTRPEKTSRAKASESDYTTEEAVFRSLTPQDERATKKERVSKKTEETAPGEKKFDIDGNFPSSADLFEDYLNGEIGGAPAALRLGELVKLRLGALETPLHIAGVTTKGRIKERLNELGFSDEYKTLAAEAKNLQHFFKNAAHNAIDPLETRSRYAQMERFRARSEQFYHNLESKLGQPETDLDAEVTQAEHAAHAEAVTDSLQDIVRMTEGMAPAPDEAAPAEPPDPYPWRKGIEKFSEDEIFRKNTEDELDAMHQRFIEKIPPDMASAALSMVTEFQTREREIKHILATSLSGEHGGMYGHTQEIEYTPEVKRSITKKMRDLEAYERSAYRDLNIEGPSAFEDARVEWKDARAEWQRVQPRYEAELKKHYDSLSSRSLWQKFRAQGEEKSPELLALEAAYLAARQRYVKAIRTGLSARAAEGRTGSKFGFKEGMRAAVAKRVVINAAHKNLELQEQSVAEHRPELVKKFDAWYGRNKKKLALGVTVLGAAATFGVAPLVRYGLKAGGAKIGGTTGVAMAKASSFLSLAALGGIVGGVVGNRAVEYLDTRKKRASIEKGEQEAKSNITEDNLADLEKSVLGNMIALRKSEKLKRNATIVGAVAGGIAGGYLGGVTGDDVYHLAGSLELPDMSYPGAVPPGAVPFDYHNENILDLPSEPSAPAENTLDLPPQENILDLPTPIPPHSVGGSAGTPPENILDLPPDYPLEGPHIPRPAGVTPPQHFEYATPEHPPIPTPRPEVELPDHAPIPEPRPLDLPDHAPVPEPRPLDLPDHAPIPEARPDYYTVQKGDSIWNIVEGDVKDRDMAEILKKIPEAHRNEDLMELRAHINADPELRARIGMQSANADLIDPGERLNMTPAYQELQKIALGRGHITEADMTVLPAAASEAAPAHAEAAYQIHKGDDLWKIIERRYHDQLAEMSKPERNAFIDAKLDALEARPQLRHELGLVRDDLDLIKETDPPLHLDVLDRLGSSDVNDVHESVPTHDIPIEQVAPQPTVETPSGETPEPNQSELPYVANPQNAHGFGKDVPYQVTREVMTPDGKMMEVARLNDPSDHIYTVAPSIMGLEPGTQFVLDSDNGKLESVLHILPHRIGDMKIEDLGPLWKGVKDGDPKTLAEMDRLGIDEHTLQEVVNSVFERGTGNVDGSLTVDQWINAHPQVNPEYSTPPVSSEPLKVREASATAEAVAAPDVSALRDATIRQVEGAPGAFRLFNTSAGSFEKLANIKMSDIVPALDGSDETVRAHFLREHRITENGFEKWIKWAADHEEELGIQPKRNETFGQFVDRVLAAQEHTVAA